MHGFDVILGMDWLSSYRALIDYKIKRVVFHFFAHSGLVFEDIRTVREFLDVFLDELPGSLVDREIEFYIYLNLGTRPIFKSPIICRL